LEISKHGAVALERISLGRWQTGVLGDDSCDVEDREFVNIVLSEELAIMDSVDFACLRVSQLSPILNVGAVVCSCHIR
jgi:hypothetical protein